MKKFLLLTTAVLAFASFEANALPCKKRAAPQQTTKQYVAVRGNYNMVNSALRHKWPTGYFEEDLNDNTVGADIAYGVKIGENWRAEIDGIINQPAKRSGIKIKNKALMLNGYYDFATKTNIAPYIGAGVGVSHTDVTFRDVFKNSYDDFVYQFMLGISYNISDNWNLDAGYKYTNYGTPREYLGVDKYRFSYRSDTLFVGGRYTF